MFTLTPEQAARNLGQSALKKEIDKIVAEGPTHLDVAARHAKRRCRSCGGAGFITVLQRAGATDTEPRTARMCRCAQNLIRRKAQKALDYRLAQSEEEKHG